MKFSDVIGNRQAVARLRDMIDADRLPHALLLHGAPGVPKLALARAATQYLHCTNRTPQGEPCGQCPSCRQHQSFNHTDTTFSFPYLKKDDASTCADYLPQWREFLTEHPVEDYEAWLSILKNDNSQPRIFVKESEAILNRMTLSAYVSKYKVLIMWLPEKLRDDAANKLLKLIEEPYDDCKFILVSDDAQAILPTIFSRTQRLELTRPTLDEVAAVLETTAGIDRRDALALAATADGNVTAALHLLDAKGENVEFHDRFVALMRQAYLRDLPGLKAWSESVADFKREKACRFLAYAARQVRENFIYNLHMPDLNYLTAQEEQFSTRFAPFINAGNVEQLLTLFNEATRDIRGNASARIVLFDMAVHTTILIKK